MANKAGKNKTTHNWVFNDVLFGSEKPKGVGNGVSKRATGKVVNKNIKQGSKSATKKAGNK